MLPSRTGTGSVLGRGDGTPEIVSHTFWSTTAVCCERICATCDGEDGIVHGVPAASVNALLRACCWPASVVAASACFMNCLMIEL